MILLCPPEKSTQFHYPLDPKKIPAEGSIHKDTTYQGSDRQDFYRHGKKKKKEKKENKQTKRRPRLGLPIGNPVKTTKWESGVFFCHRTAELPRILFGHERSNLRSTRLALIEWLKCGQRKKFVARYSGVGLVCAVNVDFGFLDRF